VSAAVRPQTMREPVIFTIGTYELRHGLVRGANRTVRLGVPDA
jgi:hypothetical protein